MALSPISSPSLPVDPTADTRVEPASFSATVAGKTYPASVTFSSGEYVVKDPAVYGVEGTGSSEQKAEEDFLNRLDFLA
ncbi:MAG TPA: hypothetical protein VHZ09_13360 [Acidobacteriaceae bacterium]|jgi:hypothetical protein|nr:hypothetical protein [Acidobacteriaceae bacterium]